MRPAAMFFLVSALSMVPRAGLAQAVVTSPKAGAQSSYRTTTISWNPIAGVTSYHLEIDDDPNFGSPEVDVTVAGTSYKLSGESLELHGQLTWAAYVRINGVRWNADTFTPSYRDWGLPAMGVNSENRVYLAFEDGSSQIQLTTSSDWSSVKRLSLADTFNTYGLNLAVDENDVAHVSWHEQRPTELWVPYYTNSSTGWNLVRIPGVSPGGCSEGSMVAAAGQVDVFIDACSEGIDRWTTSDGLQFTRTRVPNNDSATSVSAARDGLGNLFVASTRYTGALQDRHSSLQTPADGWIPHRLGPPQFPGLAVTPSGESHVLRWGSDEENTTEVRFLYSNSLRGFQTWTDLPTTLSYTYQDILPLVVDEAHHQLHAALPGLDGIRLCTAAYTGLAIDTGTSWTCSTIGSGDAHSPDLALAPDGTLHLAWSGAHGLGYANSLGSFAATNFTPQVSFGSPSGGASAVTVPVRVSDVDGDAVAGHVHVGRFQHVVSLVEPGTTEKILNRRYTLGNAGNSYIYDTGNRLQFRVMGGASWEFYLHRSGLALPALVEVRHSAGEILGGFIIASWNDTGITIAQIDFVPYVKLTYSGAPPSEIDISTLPDGAAMVAVGAWDGSTGGFGAQAFTKTSGQNQLRLAPLAATSEKPPNDPTGQ